MIHLGVNTVLFKAFSFREAAEAIRLAGYDGLEISAIQGMCEHLDPENWQGQKAQILETLEEFNLKMLSAEVASLDANRLEKAFQAAEAIGIPVVNVGPGGKTGDAGTLKESIANLKKLSAVAADHGVTLCCKAHVGSSIWNTETTLKAMAEIDCAGFGVDMDPSHIWRSGENPVDALPPVLSRTKHIHIRDCKGRGPSPGEPGLQACGRGDIDLYGYFTAMVDGKYDGPVCLEVIGPELSMTQAAVIAAESYGYMNACLKMLGAR